VVLFLEAAPAAVGILWHFRQAVLSGVLAVWVMGGAFLSLTTQKTKQVGYTAATATLQVATKVMEKLHRS
jgi:hypothetical protein